LLQRIEPASRLSFEEYLAVSVWGPAGMERIGFDVPTRIVYLFDSLVVGHDEAEHASVGDVPHQFLGIAASTTEVYSETDR
jgi:hypothetical protein